MAPSASETPSTGRTPSRREARGASQRARRKGATDDAYPDPHHRPPDPAPVPAGRHPGRRAHALDAARLQYTLNSPHPAPPGFAQDWIARHETWAERGVHLQWAVALRDETPVGAIGIALLSDPPHGDIGYWIGPEHWNLGYATEATNAVIAYGFGTLRLPRIQATCFTGNDASARVLLKAGMTEESLLRDHILKDGVPRDVRMFAITVQGA